MKSCTGLQCWQAVLWSVQQISVSTTRNSLSVPRSQGAPVVQKHFSLRICQKWVRSRGVQKTEREGGYRKFRAGFQSLMSKMEEKRSARLGGTLSLIRKYNMSDRRTYVPATGIS
jgi:hypothetical protein